MPKFTRLPIFTGLWRAWIGPCPAALGGDAAEGHGAQCNHIQLGCHQSLVCQRLRGSHYPEVSYRNVIFYTRPPRQFHSLSCRSLRGNLAAIRAWQPNILETWSRGLAPDLIRMPPVSRGVIFSLQAYCMHVLVLHALDACRSPAHTCMHERHLRLLVMACLLLIYAARPTYNAFISAYAKGDNAEKALHIWVERPLSGRDMDPKLSIQTSRRCPSEILIVQRVFWRTLTQWIVGQGRSGSLTAFCWTGRLS